MRCNVINMVIGLIVTLFFLYPAMSHAALPGDLNGDGVVSIAEVQTVINAFLGITSNTPPTANAGTAQNVAVGAIVTLDGSGSSDSNGDPLTYTWSWGSGPNGSKATLYGINSAKPTFTPDVAGAYVLNLIVNDGKANSVAATVTVSATVTVTPIEVNFSSLVGTYDGDSDVTVEVAGSILKITDADFLLGTCIYSATISAAGNTVSAGTYQCSDFTKGNWTLSQMKVVDISDIYISILRNGTVAKRLYGMSAKADSTVPPISIGNIAAFSGQYSGRSNNGPFTTDPTDITVGVTGTALKITAADFFSKTCIYSATISAAGNTVSAGTYQCSDFTTGNWTLSQMKVVDINDIYISIRKDGSISRRMYGSK